MSKLCGVACQCAKKILKCSKFLLHIISCHLRELGLNIAQSIRKHRGHCATNSQTLRAVHQKFSLHTGTPPCTVYAHFTTVYDEFTDWHVTLHASAGIKLAQMSTWHSHYFFLSFWHALPRRIACQCGDKICACVKVALLQSLLRDSVTSDLTFGEGI